MLVGDFVEFLSLMLVLISFTVCGLTFLYEVYRCEVTFYMFDNVSSILYSTTGVVFSFMNNCRMWFDKSYKLRTSLNFCLNLLGLKSTMKTNRIHALFNAKNSVKYYVFYNAYIKSREQQIGKISWEEKNERKNAVYRFIQRIADKDCEFLREFVGFIEGIDILDSSEVFFDSYGSYIIGMVIVCNADKNFLLDETLGVPSVRIPIVIENLCDKYLGCYDDLKERERFKEYFYYYLLISMRYIRCKSVAYSSIGRLRIRFRFLGEYHDFLDYYAEDYGVRSDNNRVYLHHNKVDMLMYEDVVEDARLDIEKRRSKFSYVRKSSKMVYKKDNVEKEENIIDDIALKMRKDIFFLDIGRYDYTKIDPKLLNIFDDFVDGIGIIIDTEKVAHFFNRRLCMGLSRTYGFLSYSSYGEDEEELDLVFFKLRKKFIEQMFEKKFSYENFLTYVLEEVDSFDILKSNGRGLGGFVDVEECRLEDYHEMLLRQMESKGFKNSNLKDFKDVTDDISEELEVKNGECGERRKKDV